MIDSVIATSHHYYVVYLNFEGITTSTDLIKCFTKNSIVKQYYHENCQNYTHIQLELPYLLGIDSVLGLNKGRLYKDGQHYWYDLYLYEIKVGRKPCFFICYPYIKLNDFIEFCFNEVGANQSILKPQMGPLLDYMKIKGNRPAAIHQSGFDLEIIKYSASITEEPNAKKINIFGENPLNSKVFEAITNEGSFKVEPMSLKLKTYMQKNADVLEISFDKFGNGRFWVRKKHIEFMMQMLPVILKLFIQIKGLQASGYFNNYNLLEFEDNG